MAQKNNWCNDVSDIKRHGHITCVATWKWNLFFNWVLLNRAPASTQLHPPQPSSFNLHPAPSTSTQLISASTKLSPTLSKYLNQNIARNWAISPNLGYKIKSCPSWLKIGTRGILEVLIPNPDLDFWNSNPKIYFWANLGPKIQSWSFCLKIGTCGISGMLGQKSEKMFALTENWHTWYLEDVDSYSNISFMN